jgi:hypothetical protein
MEKSPHLKRTQCALLLIDHQVGTTQLIKNINPDQSIRNAVALLTTSTNTMVAELVSNWATPQGMALVPLLVADPPILPVY